MRAALFAALVAPALLAACALTPRQQCEAPHRAELATVRAEIAETEARLRRGYQLVPATFDFGVHWCVDPNGFESLCNADDGEPMYDKRPISRRAEQAKLEALRAERKRLNAALEQCAALFPE